MPSAISRTVGLLAILFVTACGPAASATVQPPEPGSTAVPAATLPLPSATPPPTATSAPTATLQAIATSRGPDLEATDPTTVSLAAGELHFVEFFRFT